MPVLRTLLAVFVLVTLPAIASAQACPTLGYRGDWMTYNAGSEFGPRVSYTTTAGGRLVLNDCGRVRGWGYVGESADFSLEYHDRGMGHALEIRAEGDCDTVLLVYAANGEWFFNDDYHGGVNPAIRMSGAPSGTYDIWVGTLGQASCNARVIVESF